MGFVLYTIGILTGLSGAAVLFILTGRYKSIGTLLNSVGAKVKEKGEILEPTYASNFMKSDEDI